MSFAARYKKLNQAQRQAVDYIDGPLLVIAGPGTGKTELLGMRVANILQKTDGSASNILCLTFTDSGAEAMRARLSELMGAEAYKVAVHTFHSFGADVMGTYPTNFYSGATLRPATDIARFEVLESILSDTPHTNPFTLQFNGRYTQMSVLQNTIGDIKRSGLSADELDKILTSNDDFSLQAEPLLQAFFASPVKKDMLPKLGNLLRDIQAIPGTPLGVAGFVTLGSACVASLAEVIEAAMEQSTKPLTAWKNTWLAKNATGHYVLKSTERGLKLRAASSLYFRYLSAMAERELYDYDDMILRPLHAMELNDELRFNLQERYQYILVDEFQDTNAAQNRLLTNLTNNPVSEGRPNIMAVGDDDQAIYSFQGAHSSNITRFIDSYRDVRLIALTENYRSSQTILAQARDIITKGEDRLESSIDWLDKSLVARTTHSAHAVALQRHATTDHEYYTVAASIARRIKAGQAAGSIAVIGRSHSDLNAFLPFLYQAGAAAHYEKQNDVLTQPVVSLLVQLADVVHELAHGNHAVVNGLLPGLISHPAWGIPPQTIWRISLNAHNQAKSWLEVMLLDGECSSLAGWLIVLAKAAHHEPLQPMLDVLLGTTSSKLSPYTSPIKDYFFGDAAQHPNPSDYYEQLQALTTLCQHIADYQTEATLVLADFCDYVRLHSQAGLSIKSTSETPAEGAVHVLTAHKSKGLEFDDVYIINATHASWGEGRAGSNRLVYPENIPIAPAGSTGDERIRLFFVAVTRAKKHLHISYGQQSSSGKNQQPLAYVGGESWKDAPHSGQPEVQQHQIALHAWHKHAAPPATDLKALLSPSLARYKLSATHLNNFIDITRGGPSVFLSNCLLHFPKSPEPVMAYGSAVHSALQRAHAHLGSTGSRKPVEDVLGDFETALSLQHLAELDFNFYLQKGSDALSHYLSQHYDRFNFNQQAEVSFAGQHVVVGEARLSGVIDCLSSNLKTKTVRVIDYKTSKPSASWQGTSDEQKIKLHKYRQQLMFYKLLVENSRAYHGYSVDSGAIEFISPSTNVGDAMQLELSYSEAELELFKQLLAAVWQRITTLDFPDTSAYPQTYKGILAFEDDLRG